MSDERDFPISRLRLSEGAPSGNAKPQAMKRENRTYDSSLITFHSSLITYFGKTTLGRRVELREASDFSGRRLQMGMKPVIHRQIP